MNAFYAKYKEALLGAGVNLVTGTVKAVLVDTGAYAFSAAHQFLSDIPAAARIGTAVALTSKTVAGGVFDAADSTFAAVPAGTGTAAQIEALVIYRDSGTPATSELIGYFDTGVTGLPVTPNGGDIAVTWNAGGIFNL